MKKILGFILAFTALVIVGCKEQVDTTARYVFKEETIVSYLEKHEQYSEYLNIISQVKVSGRSETTLQQLLSARGNYTIFVPDNEAVGKYLQRLTDKKIISAPSWDAFPDETTRDSILRVIAYNSIIDGGDDVTYEIGSLPIKKGGTDIPLPNMADRKLVVRFSDEFPDSIYINDCPINGTERNMLALNGVMHAVTEVVTSSNNTLGSVFSSIISDKKEGFYVASQLVAAVGMLDTLSRFRDEAYENLFQSNLLPTSSTNNGETFYTPEHRYFGFTYFAETDEFWAAELGKPATTITVDDIYNYLVSNNIYPDAKRDANYKSQDNLLNQFVTYHLLPMRLNPDRLVLHYNERGYDLSTQNPTVPVMEFYTTMGKRRLMKLFESRQSNGVYINRFPELDNGRRGTYHELSCDPKNEGVKVGVPDQTGEMNMRNGIVYPLDKLLVYDDNTRDNLLKNRIRWNVTAMWPEFMNNDIRASVRTEVQHKNVFITSDKVFKYLDDVDIEADTEFYYWTGRGNGWQNMQGDEMTIRGLFEVTMRLPPVPRRGTYELRFAIQCGGNMRGMSQFYWGYDKDRLAAMGIPMDLRQGTKFRNTSAGQIPSDIGYDVDTDDDDYNAEVDKRMRNNGFMKGCNQYCAGGPLTKTMMRESDICVRRIILRETMDPDKTYYIKFKTVMDDPTRYFYMDYMEYCAKEVYDNPETPEDIW